MMVEGYPKFIALLNKYLDEQDRSASWLARRIGTSESTIAKWRGDPPQRPGSPGTIDKIAKAFGLNDEERLALLRAAGFILSVSTDEKLQNPPLGAKRHLVTPAEAQATLAAMPLNVIPPLAAPSSGSRLPLRANPLFVGREPELRLLVRWFKGDESLTARQAVSVTGIGGMGKTQLAVMFAHHYGQYFQGGVFWLAMADPASISAQVAECGAQLPEIRENYPHLEDYYRLDLATQVSLVLAVWRSDVPRLLIFDNCESPELLAQWQPAVGSCRVLITSRRSQWDAGLGIRLLPLHTLTRSQSIELLCKFPASFNSQSYSDDEMSDLAAISNELGHLPLALHLAGSYLARYRHAVTPLEYLGQLKNLHSLDHRSLQAKGISPTSHDQHVARTFALSYEPLVMTDDTDRLALHLLANIACFAPGEMIPRDLLFMTMRKGNVVQGRMQDSILPSLMEIEDALYRLIELGLVEIDITGQVVLHRLLGLFVKNANEAVYAESEGRVEAVMVSEAERLNTIGIPQPLFVWQIHLRYRTDMACLRKDKVAAELCNEMGVYLYITGELAEARRYHEQALAIRRMVLEADHLDTALSLNNLGILLQTMGKRSEAKPYYEQAMEIKKAVLGEKHPDTALGINNIGALLYEMGELAEAKPYLEKALAIKEETLGSRHADTARSLNNLGRLLHTMDALTEARVCYERALSVRCEVLDRKHPDIAQSFHNLGVLLYDMGALAEAREHLEHALSIRTDVLGDSHPHTATSLYKLGLWWYQKGETAEAKEYLGRAQAVFEEKLGVSHPMTLEVTHYLEEVKAAI